MDLAKPGSTSEALQRKRKSLDDEIAAFTSLKEREYREFERRLNSADKAPSGESTALQDVMSKKDNASQHRQSASRTEGNNRLDTHRPRNTISFTPPDSIASTTGKAFSPPLFESSPRGQKEHDFQGIFTPTYLPLLEARNPSLELDRSTSPTLPPRRSGAVLPTKSDPVTPLSSSANIPSTADHVSRSPVQSGTFSASAPRPRAHRSSSRSDTSVTSLRSILRDLKQPHSPKHVLFSIDNVVVSPSTSPLVQRSGKSSSKPPIPFSGLRDMATSSLKSRDDSSRHGGNDSLTAQEIEDLTVGSGHSRSRRAPVAFPPSFRQLVEPINAPKTSRRDSFKHVGRGDDDVFSFDEEIDAPRRNAGKDNEDDEDLESDVDIDDSMPTSSPHAGSLPIEIKWPGRRDSRSS